MGKSTRFGSEESFKSHRPGEGKKIHKNRYKTSLKKSDKYSDRELTRRIKNNSYDEDDY